MISSRYGWRDGSRDHELRMINVPGTSGTPYLFGRDPNRRPVHVRDFWISATPVTQALWQHVMGANPSKQPAPHCPADNISWHDVAGPGGFLERINSGDILRTVAGEGSGLRFRLPSESEWEYAARGGPRWTDNFAFSGSNDVDAVAWYGSKWTGGHVKWQLMKRWMHLSRKLFGRKGRPTRTHDVATKAPNQLGLYDMSGNVWEWCEDVCTDDIDAVPADGTAWLGEGTERRLRGGCHHNWDIHCTVTHRYGIVPEAHDGCIGFRIVLAPVQPSSTAS